MKVLLLGKRRSIISVSWATGFFLASLVLCPAQDEGGRAKQGNGCLACHRGIEEFSPRHSKMRKSIKLKGKAKGDPEGCIVCHGGDPKQREAKKAQQGNFYPDPGSPWVNARTCGLCHRQHVKAQWRSLMMTEAGKIQGTAWSAGLAGYKAAWGNYDIKNPGQPHDRLGTEAYKAYKEFLAQLEPQAFPGGLKALPPGPAGDTGLRKEPGKAAFTYMRQECQRCHLAVRGRQKRGDFRGMGCSACHVPYGNEGFYEGNDPVIPKDKPGHMLVHVLQSTRETKVKVHGKSYSGIPVETCTTCHDRGKRIGVSFQGLMESPYSSPWGGGGAPQPKLHTKHYIAMNGDVHNVKYNMICQDCHTTLDVHGDNFLAAATLASVEIECSDCHGTPDRYPWELPLGFGDEFGRKPGKKPRGTTTKLLGSQYMGTVYPPEDGYLLSARGNPLGNVVRRGNKVVVHTAGGKDLVLVPLKALLSRKGEGLEERDRGKERGEKDPGEMKEEHGDVEMLRARVAMKSVKKHIGRMECYSCHAQWAPQCYGCHVKIDYSGGARGFDWVAAGHVREKHGRKGLAGETHSPELMIPGRIEETRSYLRWEDPALGINGEGRVTPLIPGCQVNYTIVDAKGDTIVKNKIFHTPPGTEGSGEEGQLSIDMSPVQPHTNGKPRSCESCHASGKAAGYGITGPAPWNEGRTVDLATPDGSVLPMKTRFQVEPIPGLTHDWSQVVTRNGRQLQTVGHHFKGSRPLNNTERGMLERKGICLSCHKEIPDASLAVNILHHLAVATGQIPSTPKEHSSLVHKVVLLSAWVQVGGIIGLPLATGLFVLLLAIRRRRKASRASAGGSRERKG